MTKEELAEFNTAQEDSIYTKSALRTPIVKYTKEEIAELEAVQGPTLSKKEESHFQELMEGYEL